MTVKTSRTMSRRSLMALGAGAGIAAAVRADELRKPTRFQVACMTYVYRDFPLERALLGIAKSGYRFVAWGMEHRDADGKRQPVLAPDASADEARALAKRCRDLGLEPVMMFSNIYPERQEGLKILRQRLTQAGAAGVPQVLTFGHTENGGRAIWLQRFKELGPVAADQGVTLVVKQHGGETGTGEACAKFTRELDHSHVKVNYDAGNVMDYLDVDPIPDLKACVDEVRSFCIKDHRNFPKDEDCGPGFGEIDHYKLLHAVAWTGRALPLCCENISAPLMPPVKRAEEVDRLALRAREYLEWVIQGLQQPS